MCAEITIVSYHRQDYRVKYSSQSMTRTESHYDFCVVGAGASGLTLAYRLLTAGKSVFIVEKNERIGGLAKSYRYGGHIFDTGPKRFHTEDPVVLNFLSEVEREFVSISRDSKVHFLGEYFSWPLRTIELTKLPISVAVRCAFDLLKRKPQGAPVSFPDYIRSAYGDTLYELFFGPYTSKFLCTDAENIHSDWGVTGINRSLIDKASQASSSASLLKQLLLPKGSRARFLYPSEGGFGGFFERLFNKCLAFPSFTASLADEPRTIAFEADSVRVETASGLHARADRLVWTGNLNTLLDLIGLSPCGLKYLNTYFLNMVCRESGIERGREAQWTYVSSGDSRLSRVSCPRKFSPLNCSSGYSNLICEVTEAQDRPLSESVDALQDIVLRELRSISFLKSISAVEAIHVNHVRDTYPVYHLGYRQAFSGATSAIRKVSRRIHLLGRTGAFWYNNSDHSIRMALDMARHFLGDAAPAKEAEHYFGTKIEALTIAGVERFVQMALT